MTHAPGSRHVFRHRNLAMAIPALAACNEKECEVVRREPKGDPHPLAFTPYLVHFFHDDSLHVAFHDELFPTT